MNTAGTARMVVRSKRQHGTIHVFEGLRLDAHLVVRQETIK